jgi:hypothetical protein
MSFRTKLIFWTVFIGLLVLGIAIRIFGAILKITLYYLVHVVFPMAVGALILALIVTVALVVYFKRKERR